MTATGGNYLDGRPGFLGGQVRADAPRREGRPVRHDVTEPEPLPADSPLFDPPNAFITPHLAGSQGNEVARLGLTVVEEAERLLSGREPAHAIDQSALERTA